MRTRWPAIISNYLSPSRSAPCTFQTNYVLIVRHTIRTLGSKAGRFTNIGVSGCDTSKPSCVLKRGTNATISIDFELGKF